MNKRTMLCIILCCIILNTTIQPSIKFLKGTIDIPTPEGAEPWYSKWLLESKLVDQWYKLTIKAIKESIKESNAQLEAQDNRSTDFNVLTSDELATLFKELDKTANSGCQKMVLQLFHIAGGTLQATTAPSNPCSQLQAKDFGTIVRIMNAQSDPKLRAKELQDYLLSLKLKYKDDKEFKGNDFNPLINAINQAIDQTKKSKAFGFAPSAPNAIIAACMLKKAQTQKDIQDYLQALLNDPSIKLDQ